MNLPYLRSMITLVLAFHNHQPVGNFGWVIEEAYQKSYLPLMRIMGRHPSIRFAQHYTGILLDWFDHNHPDFAETVAREVTAGRVELLSGGYYEQDAYDRPTGVIPGSNPPTTYPEFENSGTEQPKGDVRLDWDLDEASYLTVGAGYAGTDGIIHTGIGPFDIKKDSNLTYGKVDWNKQAWRVGFFANFLDADSTNLVSVGTDGQPLGFEFSTDTYNFDVSNTSVVGTHNILTYGGNYRASEFELEIAPQGSGQHA